MLRSAEEIAGLMAAYSVSPQEQIRQTAYRFQLAQAWGIEPGQKILEIGCGQGDMTAVLAEMVGPGGHVVAVDSGASDYGAPLTLGAATDHLARGPLGGRVTFHLECGDLAEIPDDFDVAVLAHCAWYFRSQTDLTHALMKARKRAASLFLAEWSLSSSAPEHAAHRLAATMLSLASSHQPDTDRNIRKAFLPGELAQSIEEAGWEITHRSEIGRPDVADGSWEVQAALDLVEEDLVGLPEEAMDWLIASALKLRSLPRPYSALPSVVFRAS